MFFNCLRITTKCLQRVNKTNSNCIISVMQTNKYSDWYHRRPSKIVNEEEILTHVEMAKGPNEFIEGRNENLDKKEIERKPLKIRERSKPKKIKKKLQVTPNDMKFKEDGTLNITELKDDDGEITSLMMSVRSKKFRDKNSRIILEGRRLIIDALDSGAIPEIIVFSRTPDVMQLPLPDRGVKLLKVSYRTIQMWSTLVTPPGLMGFFKIPNVEHKEPASDAIPLTIICDNVRDPGNMGSILRAATAAGCKKLITLKGSVDIWDPKVLKTAAGCHFRMPIFASKTWDEVSTLIDPFSNIYVADNNTLVDTEKVAEIAEESSQVYENVDEVNSIENENISEYKDGGGDIDGDVSGLEEIESPKPKTHYQRIAESKILKKLTTNVPVIPYYSTNYTENENVIIIGGETLGLSRAALNMVKEKYGVRINIPMVNGVDSLNTGMALGIIAFEIRRQHVVSQLNKKD